MSSTMAAPLDFLFPSSIFVVRFALAPDPGSIPCRISFFDRAHANGSLAGSDKTCHLGKLNPSCLLVGGWGSWRWSGWSERGVGGITLDAEQVWLTSYPTIYYLFIKTNHLVCIHRRPLMKTELKSGHFGRVIGLSITTRFEYRIKRTRVRKRL